MNRSKIHQNNSFMPLDLFYIFFFINHKHTKFVLFQLLKQDDRICFLFISQEMQFEKALLDFVKL